MSRAVIQNTSVKEELLAQQGDGGGAEKEIKEREKKMEIFTQEVEIQDAGTRLCLSGDELGTLTLLLVLEIVFRNKEHYVVMLLCNLLYTTVE